jgi:hypothetical protein
LLAYSFSLCTCLSGFELIVALKVAERHSSPALSSVRCSAWLAAAYETCAIHAAKRFLIR